VSREDVEQAGYVFDEMKVAGLDPDESTIRSLFDLYVHQDKFDEAHECVKSRDLEIELAVEDGIHHCDLRGVSFSVAYLVRRKHLRALIQPEPMRTYIIDKITRNHSEYDCRVGDNRRLRLIPKKRS